MEIVKRVGPPTGLKRAFARMPILVFRAGLGGLFGSRLLLLEHVGRKTGKVRQVVLEVVDHDRADGSYLVASGFGTGSAWYRNVLATPQAGIRVGRRTLPVEAVPVAEEEGAEVFARYAVRHRWAAERMLPRVMGFSVDGTEEDFRAAGRRIPFVRLVPREP